MQGRLFQLWQCVRDQTEQIEKIAPPPLHILFLFLYSLFCCFFIIFFPCFVLTSAISFFFSFFLMFTNFGIPDIERRKRKRNLLIGQPQGSLSESIDTTVFICFDLLDYILPIRWLYTGGGGGGRG